ncbi:MAG: hypothetical protein JXR03_14975 [Cyclobacteriaceae bacterium]
MQQFEWREFDSLIGVEEIANARFQFHRAIQPVSAVGRKFLEHSEEDLNATLTWVPGLTRLAGKWVKGVKTFRVSLSFVDFCIYLIDEKINIISSFELEGQNQNQLLLWLEEQANKLDLDASGLTLNLPYSMEDNQIQNTDPFSVDLNHAVEFSKYYHNSFVSMRDLVLEKGIKDFIINTWPHHFDQTLSILVKDTGDTETNYYISLGMSPGDTEISQPYFYVNSWPHISTLNFEKLSHGATWHEESWTGAILLAENVVRSTNQKEVLDDFYKAVSDKLISEMNA